MNRSLSEYRKMLVDAGATLAAHPEATAEWAAHHRSIIVTIELHMERGNHDYLVPIVRVGASPAIPSDPFRALAYMDTVRRLIMDAGVVYEQVVGVRVYMDNVPCESCSERNKTRATCKVCDGTGFRVRGGA